MLTINHQISLVNDLMRLRDKVNSFKYQTPIWFRTATRWPIDYLDPPRNEAEYILNLYLSHIWSDKFPIEKYQNIERKEEWRIFEKDWAFFLLILFFIIIAVTLILKSLCSFCNRLSKLCLYKRYTYKIKETIKNSINNLMVNDLEELIETAKDEINERHASCSCTAKASTTGNKKYYFLLLTILSIVFVSLLGFLNVMYIFIIFQRSNSFRDLNSELSGSFFNFINNFHILNNSIINRNSSIQQLTNILEYKRNWTFINENDKLQTSLFYYKVMAYFFDCFEMKFFNFWKSTDISIGIVVGLMYLTTVILLIPFSTKFYKSKKDPVDRTGFSHYTGIFLAILAEIYRIFAAKLIILLLIPLLLGHFLNGMVCPILSIENNKLENNTYSSEIKNESFSFNKKYNGVDEYNKINCFKSENQSIMALYNHSYFNCSDLKRIASILSAKSFTDIELNPKWFFAIWFKYMKAIYCVYLIDKFIFYTSIWFFMSILMILLSSTLSFLSKFLMKPTFERGIKKFLNSINYIELNKIHKNQYEKPIERNLILIKKKEEESQTNISLTPDEQPQKNQFTQITPIFYTSKDISTQLSKNNIRKTSLISNSTNNSTLQMLNINTDNDKNKNMLTWRMIADDKNIKNQKKKDKIKQSIINNNNFPLSMYKGVDFDLIIEKD